MPFTNSMDFQHLRVLHGLKIDCNPDQIHVGPYKIEYDVRFEDPNLGVFDQSIRVSGTNTIALAGKLNGMSVLSMATGTPTPDGRTHGWSVTATPLTEGDRRGRAQRIQIGQAFFHRLIKEDEPIMSTIRFREGLLIEADRALAMFFQYVKKFPTAQPAAASAELRGRLALGDCRARSSRRRADRRWSKAPCAAWPGSWASRVHHQRMHQVHIAGFAGHFDDTYFDIIQGRAGLHEMLNAIDGSVERAQLLHPAVALHKALAQIGRPDPVDAARVGQSVREKRRAGDRRASRRRGAPPWRGT